MSGSKAHTSPVALGTRHASCLQGPESMFKLLAGLGVPIRDRRFQFDTTQTCSLE